MGLLVFNVKRLAPPFVEINETVFEIPANRPLRLSSRSMRVIFILGGAGQLRLEDGPMLPLQPGDAFVTPYRTRYSYHPAVEGKPTRVHALALSIRPGGEASSLSRLLTMRHRKSMHFSGVQNAAMLHYIHLLRSEAEREAPDSGLAASALASLLVLLLIRHSDDMPPPPRLTRSGTYLVEQAREFIYKNYQEPLTLEQIAWHVRLSEEYLSRLFKRVTGLTVFAFVREIRLNTAKQLLSGTNQPIVRVAEMSGFSSPQVFCRIFRQTYGLTPASYRSSHAGNANSNLHLSLRRVTGRTPKTAKSQ